ncbi:MAG TPA: MmcQ/YjbR family DNA-binding protein [Gaiellaceae bacterium]|nr:MmcQ/YjbR family DNA-binding protein [Gaiellaceae bacterium]
MAVRIDDVRDLTAGLPRSYEVVVKGRTKFRVGRIVYLAFSRDETLMGFAFPKEEREAALETYPDKFLRPKPSDMRYQWLVARLGAIDMDELSELVFDAWRMVVPKKLASLSDDELRSKLSASEPARR